MPYSANRSLRLVLVQIHSGDKNIGNWRAAVFSTKRRDPRKAHAGSARGLQVNSGAMSAVDAVDTQSAKASPRPAANSVTADFAWRVLVLFNFFRLSVGGVLLAVFYLVDGPRIVGETDETLGMARSRRPARRPAACSSCCCNSASRARAGQTYLQFATDLVAVALLIHASGGISSGMGGVLIVSVGALACCSQRSARSCSRRSRRSCLLGQQTYAQLQGVTTGAQFAPVGILGAVIFVITAVVQLLRTRLVESEALAEQRGIDLRNLVELNDYIIQHLRESIVVVDGEDHIRLINESAIKQLGAAARSGELDLATVSPSSRRSCAVGAAAATSIERRWRSARRTARTFSRTSRRFPVAATAAS